MNGEWVIAAASSMAGGPGKAAALMATGAVTIGVMVAGPSVVDVASSQIDARVQQAVAPIVQSSAIESQQINRLIGQQQQLLDAMASTRSTQGEFQERMARLETKQDSIVEQMRIMRENNTRMVDLLIQIRAGHRTPESD